MKYAKFTRDYFGELETAVVKFNTPQKVLLGHGWVKNISDFKVVKLFDSLTTVKAVSIADSLKYTKFMLDINITINDVNYGSSYEINLIPDEVIDIPEDDVSALLYFNITTNN